MWAEIRDEAVVDTSDIDMHDVALPDQVWVDIPPLFDLVVDEEYAYREGVFIPPSDEYINKQLEALLNNKRKEELAKPVEINGVVYNCDLETLTQMTQKLLMNDYFKRQAQNPLLDENGKPLKVGGEVLNDFIGFKFPIAWKTPFGFVQLDEAAFVDTVVAMNQHVQSLFSVPNTALMRIYNERDVAEKLQLFAETVNRPWSALSDD